MSTTIKQAIEAIKSRVADAYTAISNKGGTLPATQDSANLPTAIASIPSGGGSGLYDLLETELGYTHAEVESKNAVRDSDIVYSKSVENVTRFTSYEKLVYAPQAPFEKHFHQTFNQCLSLRTIPRIDCAEAATSASTPAFYFFAQNCYGLEEIYLYNIPSLPLAYNICYGAFSNCIQLRRLTLLGDASIFIGANNVWQSLVMLQYLKLGDCSRATNAFHMAWSRNLQDVEVEALPDCSMGDFFINCKKLTHTSLMNIINALPTTTNGYTLGIGVTNIAKLTAEEQALATAKGWTLA